MHVNINIDLRQYLTSDSRFVPPPPHGGRGRMGATVESQCRFMRVPVPADSGSGPVLVHTRSWAFPKAAHGFRFTVRFAGSLKYESILIARWDKCLLVGCFFCGMSEARILPTIGRLVAFRSNDFSFHGHCPVIGEPRTCCEIMKSKWQPC